MKTSSTNKGNILFTQVATVVHMRTNLGKTDVKVMLDPCGENW